MFILPYAWVKGRLVVKNVFVFLLRETWCKERFFFSQRMMASLGFTSCIVFNHLICSYYYCNRGYFYIFHNFAFVCLLNLTLSRPFVKFNFVQRQTNINIYHVSSKLFTVIEGEWINSAFVLDLWLSWDLSLIYATLVRFYFFLFIFSSWRIFVEQTEYLSVADKFGFSLHNVRPSACPKSHWV